MHSRYVRSSSVELGCRVLSLCVGGRKKVGGHAIVTTEKNADVNAPRGEMSRHVTATIRAGQTLSCIVLDVLDETWFYHTVIYSDFGERPRVDSGSWFGLVVATTSRTVVCRTSRMITPRRLVAHPPATTMTDLEIFTSLRYDPILLASADNAALSATAAETSAVYMLRHHRDRLLEAAQHFQWPEVVSRLHGDAGLTRLHQDVMGQVEREADDDGRFASSSPLKVGEHLMFQRSSILSPWAQSIKVRVAYDAGGRVRVETSKIPATPIEHLYPRTLSPSDLPDGSRGTKTASGLDRRGADVDRSPSDRSSTLSWGVRLDPHPSLPSPFTTFKTSRRDLYDAARERVGVARGCHPPREVLLVNPTGAIMEGSVTSVYFYRDGRWATPPLSSGGQAGTTRRWALQQGRCVEQLIPARSLVDGEECYLSNGVRGFIRARVRLRP